MRRYYYNDYKGSPICALLSPHRRLSGSEWPARWRLLISEPLQVGRSPYGESCVEAGACARVAARWTCVHDRYFTGQSRGPQPREGLASAQTRRPSGGYSLPGRLQLRRSTGNRPVRSGDSRVMSGTHRDFPGVIQRREQASESNGRCMLLQSAKPASMGRCYAPAITTAAHSTQRLPAH